MENTGGSQIPYLLFVWENDGTVPAHICSPVLPVSCYLVPTDVCSSVHNPDTKNMVEMSWLLAALLSLMHRGSARISGTAMMPPNARM